MKAMKTQGRTILTHDPQQVVRGGKVLIETLPVFVDLRMRKATTSPKGTRIKCVLVADDRKLMPFAQATVAAGGKPRGWTPEFRLEMN
ncbi:MAG: hypothetical protein ABW167_20555 [Baekduia sp.]